MDKINIKPLSVNDAWQGRRFKSPAYKSYERELLLLLPAKKLPPPPYKIEYEFGFCNVMSDLDNPIKQFQDVLCKKYGINDRDIYEINVKKTIVRKGSEFVAFRVIHKADLV